MTRLMDNFYNSRLNETKSTNSVKRLAEGGLAQVKCRLVASLMLLLGVFSYAQADTWNGTYSTSWVAAGITGAGTQANPYVIDSAHKFATLGYMTQQTVNNTNKKFFRLDADIDLDGANREWTFGESTANSFKGQLDGNGHTISNMKVVARSTGETGSYTSRYGLFCGLQGNDVNNRAAIKNLILENPELVVESASTNGERSGEHYYGLLVGKVHGWSFIENIKVTNPKITIKCSQTTKWNVGTIASIPGWAYAKNIIVTNPKFKSESDGTLTFLTQSTNNTNNRFSVGGVVGFISDDNRGTDVSTATDGTKVLKANYITDCAVTNADFDFHHFVPSLDNSFQYNNFSVAGVVGSHWYPIRMCENLFFSGKIKAPGAFVVPCVYIGMNNGWNKIVDFYDGEQMNDADRVEKSRSATWYYGEYKIGLSDDIFTSTVKTNGYLGTEGEADCVYLNFASSSVDGNNYVTVNPTNLKRTNRNNSTARPSRTLLWWTGSYYDSSKRGYLRQWDSKKPSDTWTPSQESDWHDGEQVIYPEINQTVGVNGIGNYPSHYMFYAQGVNMHTKYMNSAAAKSFVAGLKGNIETAMGTASKKVTLTIGERVAGEEIDEEKRPTVRGYVDHNFTITPGGANASDATSYKWYVDGVETGSGTSLSNVKPNFVANQGWQSGKGITVVAFGDASDTLAVATTWVPIYRLRVKDQESCTTKVDAGFRTYTYDLGTQSHPYLIGSENDLRLMQEQMLYEANTSNEHVYLTGINNGNRMNLRSQMSGNTTSNSPSYQQSYYEMDGNVTLTASTPFYPIGPATAPIYSGDGSSGAYRENAAFVGEFDGKGYTISGVRQEWHSGYAGANGVYGLWGLFSQISRENKYIKTGDTSASNAAVRNLIIDDIKLTHRTSNTSFYYKNGGAYYDGNTSRAAGATNWGNHCYIGTLAALVGANATIENIAVTNALVTDTLAGAAVYDLAQKQFFVGGLIGVLRKQLTNDNGSLANTVIRYVSSDADINLQYPKFRSPGNAWEQLNFLVGGIIGRMYSNAADNTLPYPTPSIFTGKIRSYVSSADAANQRAGAMAGPIFAYSAYSVNNSTNWVDFPKHFLGKTTNTAAFDATNMFYNYQHYHSDGAYHDITDTYPPVTTDWGDRNMKQVASHVNNNVYNGTGTGTTDYDLLEYQGVNQGIYASEQDPVVTSAFNDQSALTDAEQEPIKDYKWTWSRNAASRPVVTIGEVSGLYVTAKDTYNGDDVTSHIIEATVNSASEGGRTYQWYWKKRSETAGVWKNDTIAIGGATAATYTATPSVHNQYIMVRATINGESAFSDPVIVPKNQNIVATISKEAGESPVKWVMHANVATDFATPLDSTALKSENFVISYQWYKGMVGSGTKLVGETHDYLNVTDDETYIRYCIITVADSTAHSDYRAANSYTFTVSMLPANTMVVFLDPSGSGDDSNDGLSPAKAVKSWHKAYSLLRDNVTWDDNIIVLMSESDRGRTSEGFYCSAVQAGQSWTSWYASYYSGTTLRGDFNFGDKTYTASNYTPGYSGWKNGDMWKNVTITGKYNGTIYPAVIEMCGGYDNNWCVYGDTRFKNLTFYGSSTDGNGGNNYDILYCFYNSVEMGDSLVMTNFRRASDAFGRVGDNADNCDFQIFGGAMNDGRFKETTVSGFDNALMEAHLPHGNKGFEINIKSGYFSAICSTYRQNTTSTASMIGTPNMPVKCTMNIDIDQEWNEAHKYAYNTDATSAGSGTNNKNPMTYDVGMLLAGNHEGSMYGDVDINVYSGRVGRASSGNLGAIRDVSKSGTYYMPLNSFMGRANIVIDPEKSRLAKTDGMTKNERVTITEIYGGGLGRSHGSDGMVLIPFYGKNSITINGGTLQVLYRTGTSYPSIEKVTPGVFATGAGGINGMYHVAEDVSSTGSQRLPYWQTDKAGNVTLYGDWSTYSSKTGDYKVYIKCYNPDTDDYTEIDPEDTETSVTINDGVFGTAEHPIYGIYGGGSGFVSTDILPSSNTYPNYRSGNMYAKKDADHPVATLTINGGEFYCKEGIFAGGRGTDYYFKTARTNAGDGTKPAYHGNYTALGQVYGDVVMNITGGTFHDNGSTYIGNIYGGGLGFGDVRYNNAGEYTTLKDMARIYGTTTVNITGGTFEGNVYGGGAIANTGYGGSDNALMTPEISHYGSSLKNAVNLNISGAIVKGKVFGAAQGKTNVEVTQAPDSIGNIYGNISLVMDNDTIGGDIYGGAEKGDVYGNVTASISNSGIAGNIYGGGMGVLSGETVTASADIKGSTMITLGKGTSYVTLSDGKYVADYSTAHYIYGGGNLASVIGIYTGSPVTAVVSGGNTTVNVNNGMGTGQLSVFGAGYGANTYCNMTNVNINSFDKTKTVGGVTKVFGLKEVYGGGNLGTVYTSTNVAVNGGQVLGSVFGGGNLAPVGTLSAGTYPYEPYGTMVSMASTDAHIYGDIFGGGNKADVSGVAQVNVTRGSFAGQVFGGGKGEMTNDNTVGTAANINGQTNVMVDGAHVLWNTLWDSSTSTFKEWNGEIGSANQSLFVTTTDDGKYYKFLNPHNIFGGGYLACTVSDTARVEVTNGAVPSTLIKKLVWQYSFADDNNPHFYVFGGGYGPFTKVDNTQVTVGVEGYFSDDEDESTGEQWAKSVTPEGLPTSVDGSGGSMDIFRNNYGIGGYTILGVIGGGYAGLVDKNTDVTLGGTTFVHRVYGGGYGHRGEYDKLLPATNMFTSKTRENLGEVGGSTRVTVGLSEPDENGRTGGVYGDVFGGGAGVESYKYDGSTYTDFTDMGKVRGVTRVDVIENARVYGNVYGGGDVANVANTSNADSVTVVKMRGGDVFGSIFGGGKGRISAMADNYNNLGNVFGNAYVIVRDSVGTDDEGTEYTISPNVWGTIYGGGQVGDIKQAPNSTGGNADIFIEGGNIGNNVYGAGYGDITDGVESSANVAGNTVIRIDGGSYLWKQIADEGGNVRSLTDVDIVKETAQNILQARRNGEASAELSALKTQYKDVFDYDNNWFFNDHNIYGGGNTVSTVTGNATITVNHGMLNDDIAYYDDKNWTLSSLLKQLVTGNNSHPQFSVLGGGYGINTTIGGNATVNVRMGDEDATYANKSADRATWDALFNTTSGVWKTDYDGVTDVDKDNYYGGTSGTNGLNRYVASRLANCFSIPNHSFMNIVGGGMAGRVTGNTEVNISDQTMCQNVFGGGIGIMPTGTPTGNETYGQVGGTSTVNITGAIVAGNVYGGGAGMESYDNNGTYIDFTEMGAVDKNTSVTIDGTPTGTIVFGKVFGGGDVANVKNSAPATYGSEVTIQGGCVYQQVFAGGSGMLASESGDYTALGKVTGDTRVTIQEGATAAPWLWNRVYGGGSYGSVTGNTYVNITGGHLGYNIFGAGLGDVRTLDDGTESVTTSLVDGGTNVNISGGEWCLSQMWDINNRNWVAKTNTRYSSQYDVEKNKFLINHNIYGGGNAASTVSGIARITMTKSPLKGDTNLGHDDDGRTATSLWDSFEWKEIYAKTGSFHFCVIGGGYGERTSVDSTVVNINLTGDYTISASDSESSADVLKSDLSTAFQSEQSVMDVIGGGYNGAVAKGTNVTIQGDPYLRRAFGGSFYASVNNTKMDIKAANVDDVFAGCMMGDVQTVTRLNVGSLGSADNSRIYVNHDIHGGNDVSGQIDGLITVNVNGGRIYHNIYGAGNGNYLYALNEDLQKVTTVEDSIIDDTPYALIYQVPRRTELMPASAESSSEAARLVNINSYRPLAQYVRLNVAGSSADNGVRVFGGIFGGGNTATLTMLDGTEAQDTVNIGNYVTAEEVYMGADGTALFDENNSGVLIDFIRLNGTVLSNRINWVNDPYNKAITEKYLPLTVDDRQKTYKTIVDLYFQPVEMPIQPVLMWNGTKATTESSANVTGTTIGSFFCGGNRGNMDVTPDANGNAVDYLFPSGLTIKDKIVGGCNNANFIRTDLGDEEVNHQGGYLLGSAGTAQPMIKLKVKSQFDVASSLNANNLYTAGNIYGGCHESGTINGDIHIDVQSNMINGLDAAKLANTIATDSVSAASVYGAGQGQKSYVYGNIEVAFGTSATACTQGTITSGAAKAVGDAKPTDAVTTINDTGFSVASVYGGGQEGNVIGNTTIKILNGHVAGSVCGGSFSGIQYGSSQVLVGYPQYYTANESGIYPLNRADKRTDNLALLNYGGSKAVKDSIRLIQGDIIAPAIRDSIVAHTAANASKFTLRSVTAPADWSKVSIQVDEAVYGGGYATSSFYSSSSASGGSGSYTVRKYTSDYNANNYMSEEDPLYNRSTAGYGGNTTVLVWDRAATDDHIAISTESSEGGLFGGGHESYAEGFRSGELKGYGYAGNTVSKAGESEDTNNAKVINTIQRFDVMRLTDNCVILNGARDYTVGEVSSLTTTPYSLSRIGELQMVSTISKDAALPRDSAATAYRNYVGLMNNIHYVGAISSNAKFTDDYHNAWGAKTAGTSYKTKKQEYITNWYSALATAMSAAGIEGSARELTEDEILTISTAAQTAYNTAKSTFNRRNDATSVNMIGLSSGYALKVQNVRTTDANGGEEIFYGPIDGVVEIKLIQPILDEGGGYVYADNVHDNPDEFLETTGNFVFPAGLGGGQYVVDDCLLTNFDALKADSKNAEGSEMHYWFLTGNHYFYNLHITGYTFDSSSSPLYFDADTSDGLTILEGATNDLAITGIKWKHHHNADGTDDATYNDVCDIEKTAGYTLRLSASNATDAQGKTITLYNETEDHAMYHDVQRDSNLDNGSKKPEDDGYVKQGLHWKKSGEDDVDTGSKPSFNNPLLAIQLVDQVNNSARNYYNDRLSKPDTVVIELRSKPMAWKTYTINLIINYVKGPTYTGNLSVANCALPGEYIKIRKDGITIDADPAFAQNGEFLRIGKLDATRTALEKGALTYDASGKTTSEVLKGKVYSDPSGKYLMIPAYYFMNGYGVQYVFTCNNMKGTEFPVDMQIDGVSGYSKDTLTVHNYHQMKPRSVYDIDLRITEAMTRAANETGFAEPRIYIKDATDLQTFQQFIDTVGVNVTKIALPGHWDDETEKYDSLDVPTAGANAQFFLQNDITVQQTTPLADLYYTTPAAFAGTLHGDGHLMTGIDSNLFTTLAATGKVYNLGLESGAIAGSVTTGGKISTSYEYGNLKAYNMNGVDTTYTADDFHYGKVAYNLNQYYLEARKKMLDAPTTTQAALANETALDYVKGYYLNGDYQYARQYDASTGTEYLRTNAHPHYYVDVMTEYDGYTSFHNTAHTVDQARAVDKAVQGNYRPLFNAAKVDATSEADVQKNDYIFFGQALQAEPENHPATIASHDVSGMTNRVYRASGFYRSMVDEGYHFNANTTAMYSSYVSDPKTTAVDFTGKRNEGTSTTAGWRNVADQYIYYAPACDLPAAYYGLQIADDVTKNLLVYTDNQTAADNTIANIAQTKLNYTEDTDEADILGHRIQGTGSPKAYTAARLHLVDLQNFNAPIQFTADTAWYDRNPAVETGYVEDPGKAWQSVSLPYTVQTATLSEGITRYSDGHGNGSVEAPQTSITYFFGDGDTKALNPDIINHEFWLRRLTNVATTSGELRATFKRPTYKIGNTQGFAAYHPFIVSFPGNAYYEFDMTGQTITFGAGDAVIKVTDTAVNDSVTTVGGYSYYGAYLNGGRLADAEAEKYAINLTGEGDRFESGADVLPFRGYITPAGGGAAKSYILIGDDMLLEEVGDSDVQADPDGGITTQSGLRVYGVGKRIVVVSDSALTLPVYNVSGALVRVLDVLPGTSTYSGFKQGIYLVDQKKIRLR